MATTLPSPAPADLTFRNYSYSQAETYAKNRPEYPPALINFIVDHHRATGGKTGVLLDVGCGPGTATRALSPHFDVVFGADAGDAMIKTATELGGATATGAPIQFRVCPAEEIDKIKDLEHGSVDMITAAVAAHWFEMPKFWTAAAKLLKPGGTVALWTYFRKHRESLAPEAAKVHDIISNFREVVLGPYRALGTRLAQSGYVDLMMPWDEAATAPLFERETFLRHELDINSEPSYGVDLLADGMQKMPFKRMEGVMETIGAVTRWREAHPELVGTDKDCVKIVMGEVREALGDGKDTIDVSTLVEGLVTVVLCVKRAK